jgi:hypothetical protein
MAGELWVRLIRKNHTVESRTVPCARDEWLEALDTACHGMDISRPMIMQKHVRDWDAFSQTRFLRDHFMDSVGFDRMELEYIDPDIKKKTPEARPGDRIIG